MDSSKRSSSASEASALPETPRGSEARQSGGDRRARLYLQHPEETPELIGSLPYLIHPPSKLASSDSWRSFRDRTLLPMIQERPADRNLPNFLRQVEAVLAWRAAVPVPDRFWKPDPDQKP